eukprot:6483439-Amphidinium_carterae.1
MEARASTRAVGSDVDKGKTLLDKSSALMLASDKVNGGVIENMGLVDPVPHARCDGPLNRPMHWVTYVARLVYTQLGYRQAHASDSGSDSTRCRVQLANSLPLDSKPYNLFHFFRWIVLDKSGSCAAYGLDLTPFRVGWLLHGWYQHGSVSLGELVLYECTHPA